MNEVLMFARFTHVCVSQNREGRMYFIWPFSASNPEYNGRWLTIEELYEVFNAQKDSESVKNLLTLFK